MSYAFLQKKMETFTYKWVHLILQSPYYRVIEELDEKHPKPIGNPVETTVFVDSIWAGDTDNRRSTSGIVAFVNNTPYRWLAKGKLPLIVVLLLLNLVL